MTPAELVTAWRSRANELRPYAPAASEAFGRAALELDAALREQDERPLTLAEAATESGYSTDRLRHLIADGELPNAGRKGAPRVRRSDLPRKKASGSGGFDAAAAARRVLSRS